MTQTTPRILPLPRAEWTDEARDVFAYWEGPTARENGSQSNTMMTLANHPPLAIASLDFGKYILIQSSLTARQKELIVLRVAWRYDSQYQWTHHVHAGRKVGITDAEFEALQFEGENPVWNRSEQAFISAMDQLCAKGRIDDSIWAILSEDMTKTQIMDFLYTVGLFTMNAWAFGAMGVELEANFAAFSKSADEMVQSEG
ncbi:carboxymuconolactone decarboxylase family protein [Sphingobium sufflavum]|uniref:carboxymuconolactone decarboxylase family protein n=1 Tax=Sphingobium sufflavum TaxID=1129547 RepID=UPI001F183E61|nr:carboxymuconolactone decarboxylase family protein [Sphingobium sufflavum]MCE7798867.1 carboxymuconolactone decarboxylase family protein [Sphingobium sufflavum]